ncbi:MAG: restriction endonuclease subunit S [Candidatus Paceibacterota bacterium]
MRLQLGQLSEVRMGYHIRGRVQEEPGGNALLLQIRDVDDEGRFDEMSLTVVDVPNLENHSLRGGDVVFLARGVARYAFLFEGSQFGSIVPASYFMVLRVKDAVEPAYLTWAINQDSFQRQIESASTKSAVPQITKTALVELTIDLPNFETQRRVAAVDRLMKTERELLQRLQDRRSALLRAASRGTSR